ncbi:uncharacterized protein LOC106093194 [Stomoxys calcitrans]|uniref:Uncharacterized protein n=1 Tax=Stomoxys calcitrans TaxID=35570 RepID=A0A1I8NZF0_STOCA|nr:uncharacterized protein LOC106093194 [Stomoxys calcitrans]
MSATKKRTINQTSPELYAATTISKRNVPTQSAEASQTITTATPNMDKHTPKGMRADSSSKTALPRTTLQHANATADIFPWAAFDEKLNTVLDTKLSDVAKMPGVANLHVRMQQLREETTTLKAELNEMKQNIEMFEQFTNRSNVVVAGYCSPMDHFVQKEFVPAMRFAISN